MQKERIIELAINNGGYVLASQIKEEGIPTIELTRLVKNNKLERISKGYYILKDTFVDEYYIYQSKSKNSIYSFSTALYLHDLSDRTPLFYDISVPVGYNGSLLNDNNIKLHYVKKELFEIGLTVIKFPFGIDIKVYDMERTLCDIIKYKSKTDIEVFSVALKRYASNKNKDLNKLVKYAKLLKIDKKVREYMEVLI